MIICRDCGFIDVIEVTAQCHCTFCGSSNLIFPERIPVTNRSILKWMSADDRRRVLEENKKIQSGAII